MTTTERIAFIDSMAKNCISIIKISNNEEIGMRVRAIMEDLNRLSIEIEDEGKQVV